MRADLAAVDDSGVALAGLQWSDVVIGTTPDAKLHVKNLGSASSGPIALALSGAQADEFLMDSGTTCLGRQLAPMEQCDIVIRFAPRASGAHSGILGIAAAPGGSIDVLLQGQAGTGAAIDLGQPLNVIAAVGASTQATIDVDNTGDLSAAISSITVQGAGFAEVSTTCGGTLGAGASCTVTIAFTPAGLTTSDGAVLVTADGSTTTLVLHGVGGGAVNVTSTGNGTGRVTSLPVGIDCGSTCSMVATQPVVLKAVADAGSQFAGWSGASCSGITCTVPLTANPTTVTAAFQLLAGAVVLEPTVLDFGMVPTGDPVPASETVQVVNNTANDAQVTAIQVTGSSAFTLGASTCFGVLPAGTSCSINIKFVPLQWMTLMGTLTVTVDGSDLTAQVSGTGAGWISVQDVGTGTGTVTSIPPGIDCGATCSMLSPTPVQVIGTPDPGSVFVGFGQCPEPCTIAPGHLNATPALFELQSNMSTLAITVNGPGTGKVYAFGDYGVILGVCVADCTVPMPRNEQIVIYPAPDVFLGMTSITGACTASNDQCSFTTSLPASATVTFY